MIYVNAKMNLQIINQTVRLLNIVRFIVFFHRYKYYPHYLIMISANLFNTIFVKTSMTCIRCKNLKKADFIGVQDSHDL